MKTAYSYQRWSTSIQGESTRDSSQRQSDSAARWIRDYGKNQYILSNEKFVDAGKSAFKGKNIEIDEYGQAKGELQRFIQLVKESTIKADSILLIDSYDRFSRMQPTKSLTLFLEVIHSGIGLVFTGSYEKRIINAALLDNEPNVLQFIIGEMIRSHAESAEKSRKIKSAKATKKAQMQSGQIVPHNNMPTYFTWSAALKRYEHNKNTPIVKELVDGLLAGKSFYGMADDLNRRKIPTFRRGFEWAGNSIHKILENRILIGEYIGVKNFVPPIIDEDTFNRVQAILARNTFNRGKRATLPNIFRGICFCATCGKSMSVSSQVVKGIEYRYLKCSVGGLGKHHTCKNKKLIRLDEMEVEFFTHFLSKSPYDLINADDKAELKQIRSEITNKQTRLNKLTTSINDAVSLLGVIKADELKRRLAQLEEERTSIKHDIDTLNQKALMIQDAPSAHEALSKTLHRIVYYDAKGEMQHKSTASWKELNKMSADMDIIEDMQYDISNLNTNERTKVILEDEQLRENLRLALHSIINKVTVDGMEGKFYIYNRVGKMIYESKNIANMRNASQVWKDSLKKWTTRKVSGKAITVKRKKY